jgi:hypothetical protein
MMILFVFLVLPSYALRPRFFITCVLNSLFFLKIRELTQFLFLEAETSQQQTNMKQTRAYKQHRPQCSKGDANLKILLNNNLIERESI